MRKRVFVAWTVGLVLFCIGVYLAVSTVSLQQARTKQLNNRSNLPTFVFEKVGGGRFSLDSLPEEQYVYVLLIDPTCSYCIDEVEDILHNKMRFTESFFLFISSVPFEQLTAFSEEIGLKHQANIRLLHTDMEYAAAVFGQLPIPTTLVYNKQRQLIKEFFGQASLAALLSAKEEHDE